MSEENYFVPSGTFGSRQETATALVGAADEFGLNQRDIRSAQGGFWITESLADKVFNDVDESDDVVDDVVVDDDADNDPSGEPETKTPEGTVPSEEQADTAPAKKSRSKKNDTPKE